jgi:hypothetical protein
MESVFKWNISGLQVCAIQEFYLVTDHTLFLVLYDFREMIKIMNPHSKQFESNMFFGSMYLIE